MPKVTQKYKLWTLLSSGKVVTPAEISKTLGIKAKAVSVYVHKLRKRYKADVEVSRDGKEVTGYRLVNKITVPEYRRNNAQYDKDAAVKKLAKSKAKNATVLPEVAAPATYGEKEIADISQSLGIENTSTAVG